MNIPPHIHSEANVQAEFYHQCRLIGLNCSLEMSVAYGRLDAAVFDQTWTQLVAIVETKKKGRFSMRQINRYKKLGVPVYGLSDPLKAAKLASTIQRLCIHGPTLESILSIPRLIGRARDFSHMNLCEEVNFKA